MSYPVDQPEDLTMGKAFMCTIGIVVNSDRCAIVLPMAYSGSPVDVNAIAASCNDAALTNYFPLLVPLISSDAYISFIQAEGMFKMAVPDRVDFAPADHPGTGTAGVMPSQVGGLLYFIMDQRDAGFVRKKIAQGKNFIPGIPRDQVVGDNLVDAWRAAALTLTNQMQKGSVPSTIETGLTWWRVLGKATSPPYPAPPTEATVLKRVFANGTRGYLVTQRRRLIPR